jgi:hypothetical protein
MSLARRVFDPLRADGPTGGNGWSDTLETRVAGAIR